MTKTFISIYWNFFEEGFRKEVDPNSIEDDGDMIIFGTVDEQYYAINKSKVCFVKYWEETDETQS